MPKQSIITINLNNKAGLEKTIRSVVDQTFEDFEYIVIDGASTDGSVEVVKQYADQIDYWVSEPDTGIYNAMNKGIKAAKGEYLLFLNSGDYLYKEESLELAVQYLDKGIDIYTCNLLNGGPDKKTIKAPGKITFELLYNSYLPHPSSFIKADSFREYGTYNEGNKIVSDWEFFFLVLGIKNGKYQKIPITLTVFDTNGLSNDPKMIPFIEKERRQVFKKLLGSRLLEYFDENEKMKKRMSYRRYTLMNRLEENPLLRKTATVFLMIICSFLPKNKN